MPSESIEVLVPHETVNDDSLKLLKWHISDGAQVKRGDMLVELETSKAVLELEASESGFVQILVIEGQEVPVGQVICRISSEPATSTPNPAPQSVQPLAKSQSTVPEPAPFRPAIQVKLDPIVEEIDRNVEPVRFSPLAATMAKEANIGLSDFVGIRIVTSKDVQNLISARSKPSAFEAPPLTHEELRVAPAPIVENLSAIGGVPIRWEKQPRRKEVEVKTLAAGTRHVLASSVTVSISTFGLAKAISNSGVPGLSLSVVVVYETAKLLKKFPEFNALYSNGQTGYYEKINIGWAIDDGSGLMVPVIKDASEKTLAEIASEANDLLEKYVTRKLGVEDFLGATFTISDLSSERVSIFTPLISQNQSAILGISGEVYIPGLAGGLQNFTLAFDHQVADGRLASNFLNGLVERLQGYEATFSPTVPSSIVVKQTETPRASKPGQAEDRNTLVCAKCFRDAATLLEQSQYLVKSAVPDCFVCSYCLAGF